MDALKAARCHRAVVDVADVERQADVEWSADVEWQVAAAEEAVACCHGQLLLVQQPR